MKKTKEIDWAAVRAAQKRGKYGRMLPNDFELCNEAWRADPKRYQEQAQAVHEEVFGEITLSGWSKDKEAR
jgi:hypothetical protein